MSYNRETLDSGIDVITYYYLADDLFEQVSLMSLYRAKSIISQGDGKSLVDDYGITVDEQDIFDLFAKTAIHDAFAQCKKMTKGLTNAIFVKEPITDVTEGSTSTLGEDVYGFRIIDNAAYSQSALFLVDDAVKNLLWYSILFQWFDTKGLDAEAAKYKAKYEETRRELVNERLFQLRKPLIA